MTFLARLSRLWQPDITLPRIVILISGRGSNMRVLLQKSRERKLLARCTLVVSDRPAKGLEIAKAFGVPAILFAKNKGESREEFDHRLAERLKQENPDLVVCAGYLRILSRPMLEAFPNRIVNIHPSLLPAFPGLHAQKQALDYGVKISGCTVHLVDAGVDTGKILAQRAVPVMATDTEETLSRRILAVEHDLYWRAINDYLKQIGALRKS
ncbi:MAG: phosphoribosylglycinamide formyltransferase [Turneriella sp.]|nr:phosphoribosylglycinamide formyltransferase [Leptospiraceae bacterium]MCX7632253.1 phosphoribosylglycinamide formyltransferase [Turneriella sp.]